DCDIATSTSMDCNMNGIPDECEKSLVVVSDDQNFTTDVTNLTPGGTTGWTQFTENTPGRVVLDYDSTNTALRSTVSLSTTGFFRISGWASANSEWLPYSAVGSDHYVRGKFYVFRADQANAGDFNQIPGVRMRLSNRFAVNSMLEVFSHLTGFL